MICELSTETLKLPIIKFSLFVRNRKYFLLELQQDGIFVVVQMQLPSYSLKQMTLIPTIIYLLYRSQQQACSSASNGHRLLPRPP